MEPMKFEKAKTYQEIKKIFYKCLTEKWQPNDRLPPIRDLARNLGIGQSSTYKAVKELVREGVLVSRPKMGTYVSHDLEALKPKLKMLVNPNTHINTPNPLTYKKIQVITYRNEIENPVFFSLAIEAFKAAIPQVGYEVTTSVIEPFNAPTIEPFVQKETHGVVVVNPSVNLNLNLLPSQVLTIINPTIDCSIAMSERFDIVTVDDTQGTVLAGEFLTSLGWQNNTGFIGVEDEDDPSGFDTTSSKRLKGLCMGLGIQINPQWCFKSDSYSNFDAAPCVIDWLKLDPRPTMIFAASDDLAYGFISGAYGHGLHPGRDYQIMGFDAQKKIPFNKKLVLTSIAIPIEEMGTLAARTLMKRLNNPNATPQRIYLGCTLFEGNTVVRASGSGEKAADKND